MLFHLKVQPINIATHLKDWLLLEWEKAAKYQFQVTFNNLISVTDAACQFS